MVSYCVRKATKDQFVQSFQLRYDMLFILLGTRLFSFEKKLQRIEFYGDYIHIQMHVALIIEISLGYDRPMAYVKCRIFLLVTGRVL